MKRFYWVVEGVLAGCERPGGAGQRVGAAQVPWGAAGDMKQAEQLDADLAWLREQGVQALLSLTETPLPVGATERWGLTTLHLPVPDMTAPTPQQLDEALRFIDQQRAQGRAVAAHCLMGQGRTGTALAAYLIRGGMTAQAAVRELRALCPGAISAAEQERALEAFARRRDWIV